MACVPLGTGCAWHDVVSPPTHATLSSHVPGLCSPGQMGPCVVCVCVLPGGAGHGPALSGTEQTRLRRVAAQPPSPSPTSPDSSTRPLPGGPRSPLSPLAPGSPFRPTSPPSPLLPFSPCCPGVPGQRVANEMVSHHPPKEDGRASHGLLGSETRGVLKREERGLRKKSGGCQILSRVSR